MPPAAAIITKPADATPEVPTGLLVPFTRASYEHAEPANLDDSRVQTANSQLIGPVDVPSYGYLRSMLILVEATGGTGVAAVAKADAPWSVLGEVALHDVGGAPIVGPFTGYDLYLANRWGGYAFSDDPSTGPATSFQSVQTNGNFKILLRVPLEIGSRDGLGALPNMNAATTYKLRISLADLASVYSVNPTGIPTVRVRAWAECWAAPSADNDLGQPQAVQPPALGTTQMWSKQINNINNGFNTVQFKRVGNLLRTLILVYRDNSGVRTDTGLPDPLQLYMDGRLLTNEGHAVRRNYMRERYNIAAADAGVTVFDWAHDFDGRMGGELRDQWLQTAQSTRFELQATYGAAGSLAIMTNDVAPVGNVYLD